MACSTVQYADQIIVIVKVLIATLTIYIFVLYIVAFFLNSILFNLL